MNIKPLNTSSVKLPFEKIHHFVATPSLSVAKRTKSPILAEKAKLKPLPAGTTSPITESESEDNDTGSILNLELLDFEVDFENFMVNAFDTSYITAIENLFKERYNAFDVILWEKSDTLNSIFSFSHNYYIENNECLAGRCFAKGEIINTSKPSEYEGFSQRFDSKITYIDSTNLIFVLKNYRNEKQFVVQVVMPPGSKEFDKPDINFVKFFQRKFQIFSRYLIDAPLQEPLILDLLRVDKTVDIMHKISDVICSIIGCKTIDVYMHNKQKKKMAKHTKEETIMLQYDKLDKISTYVKNELFVNAQKIDDNDFPEYFNTPVMIIPITNHKTQITTGIVLHGEKGGNPFSPEAERMMRQFAPVISLAINNSIEFTKVFSDYKKTTEEREGLSALLEVAEILSRQLDTGRLCEIIMEKGRYLTQADRCSLFLVSPDGKSLTTSFHRGLKEGIEIPISKGVVGKTVTDAKPLNIEDAYSDPSFSPATDIATGYKTKSILSVPIFNNRGKVMGVTEMINKKNGQVFTTWDTNLIQIFNVFCGISLENARLYNESLDMSQKLKSFFGISFSLTKTEDIKRIMADIIKNARKCLQARRASMFVIDDTKQELKTFICDGNKMPATFSITEGIIGACVRTKTAIYTNDPKNDPRFNPRVDEITEFTSCSLCAAPMISTEGQVLGVVEMVNKINGNFSDSDLNLLKAFASFASISMENSRNKSIIPASTRSARPMWINDQRPDKLLLSEKLMNQMSTLNFNAQDQPDEDLVRMVFTNIINFGICETLNCSNEVMVKFLNEIRLLYTDNPYHNWNHACDVIQFLVYELKTIDKKELFTPLEIAGLFIAALCHDAGHDGYTNSFNIRARTPLGILFKGQSACEMLHCSLLAHVCSNRECNIFEKLSHPELTIIWDLIISLILATDITTSGKVVDEASTVLQHGNCDFSERETRYAALKILLLSANISNVARPFETAIRWCDSLTDEYFKQGDTEKAIGLDFTSPYNDRTQPNKPGLEATFIEMQCMPILKLLTTLFPKLSPVYEAVCENLNQWVSKNQ